VGHEIAGVDDEPVGGGVGDDIREVGSAHREQFGGGADLDPGDGQIHHVARTDADRGVGLIEGEVPRGDQQRCRLQRVTAAHRIEGVAHIVGAGTQPNPGIQQRAQGGEPPRGGDRMLPALQVEVGDRQRDDADVAGEHLVDDLCELSRLEGAETHAVAGRDRHLPVPHDAGQLAEGRVSAEALVGVHVHADAATLGDGEQPAQVVERRGREVRCPADQVDAEVESGFDSGVGKIGCRQRDQLDVHQVAQLLAHPHQRPDPAQRLVTDEQVDVAADGGGAVGEQPQRGGAGTFGDAVFGHHRRVRPPGIDRPHQVTHRRVDQVPGHGLVEVGVGFGRRRQQQEARQVEVGVAGQRAGGGDLDHRSTLDPHVHDGAIGGGRVSD